MDGRQVLEEGAELEKGGACIEAFEFTVKGKPEPRHASLLRISWARTKTEKKNMAGRLLNELILSKFLQYKTLEVYAHVSVAMELDTDRTFWFR